MSEYVPYHADVEIRADDEDALTAEILDIMAESNRKAFERHRHAVRDAHAKSHGFLKGELVVPKLPDHLRQGLFARPATYPVIVRLSSAPGDIHSDTIPAPRGMAIKVIGVDGDRLLADDAGHNQDFLLVNIPVLSFGTIKKYRQLVGLLEKNAENPAFLQRAMAGVARGVETAVEAVGIEPGATLKGLARDNAHLLGETYHSMAAIRFGDYIAKISAAPLSENVRNLTGQDVGDIEDGTMRDLVVDHFRQQAAEYELRAQLCRSLDHMPVEDAAVLWPEELSPHQRIATLRIPAQEAYSPARRVYGDDVLSFNPWHGIKDHQPLGSIMRIRIAAYERSAARRHLLNAQPRVEPASIDEIPD
ncbi:catalase family protein [Rhizobium pusense]|uniref:catalase family protein n=1 Tax=Agrobacterium pusense TaxID=648995 RepID=UPI002447B30F|nr:catalase family protein [Agrobacterium pusense]MDH1271612.1 catalase family protein [Agrobacterium pusense]